MKRYIAIQSMAVSLIVAFIIIFTQEGYYVATFLRNDLLYYMLYIPLISIMFVFGFVYMVLGINWKQNILIEWYKIIGLIGFVFSFIVLLFMPNIYMTVSTSGQLLVVSVPLVMFIVSSTMIVVKK